MKELEIKLYTTEKEAESLKYNLNKIKERIAASADPSSEPTLLRDYHMHMEGIESNAKAMDYFERNLLLAKIELSQFDLQEMHSAASIAIDIDGHEFSDT